MTNPQLDVRDLPLARAGEGFRRGRGRTLFAMFAAAATAVFGLWLWLSYDDEARVYGELGRKLNGMRQTQFDMFWQCVLEDVDLSSLRSNTELLHWLRISVDDGGAEYGAHLREMCVGTLDAMESSLDSLIAPADLERDIATLKAATSTMQRQFRALTACLAKGKQACSADDVEPELQAIARGWFDFQTAHASVNETIRSRLEKP